METSDKIVSLVVICAVALIIACVALAAKKQASDIAGCTLPKYRESLADVTYDKDGGSTFHYYIYDCQEGHQIRVDHLLSPQELRDAGHAAAIQ